MKRILLLVGAFAAGAVIVLCGREAVGLARIAFGRTVDRVVEKVLPVPLQRKYDEVIAANTEQAAEIERYLDHLNPAAKRTPEALGLNFASEAKYRESCAGIRSLLASSLGYPPPGAASAVEAPALARLSEDELATYYELSVTVFDGVRAGGVFMMPRSPSGKVPLVIAIPGRGPMPARPAGGKMTVVGRGSRDLARGALRRGYAVWEPILAFYAKDYPADIRERLAVRAVQCGTTLPAIEIAKITRGLDALLLTGKIDSARIAMVGVSFGGFYTLYSAALDERISVAVVAAYINDRQLVLGLNEPFGNLEWRFPNSLSVFQDATMAALICPRPLQVQAGDHDQLFPIKGSRETVPGIRFIYERLGIGQRFSFAEFVGRHDFRGDLAYKFIGQFFDSK
ncbi:MAG: hypothetical protein M3Z22_08120 [Verrucomicrobiota bacterium]|nr:hypothetical protein [Verrucomicrobiota bacterium]